MNYETIIKVLVVDPPEKRAEDIERGIGYACALLKDEYGRTEADIDQMLEDVRFP